MMCCHNHCDTAIISIIIYNLSLYTAIISWCSHDAIIGYHSVLSWWYVLWQLALRGTCGAPVKPECEQSSNLLTFEKTTLYEELSRIPQQSPCFSCCEIRRLLTASLRVSPPLALWQLPGAAKPRDPESQGHARSPFITCFFEKS